MKKKLSLLMVAFLGVVGFMFAAAYQPTELTGAIYLTKANIEAQDYLSVSKEQWQSEKTYDGVTGQYYNMSSADRLLKIDVKGVSKFEVFVYNTNTNRSYNVTVGNGSAQTIAHNGSGLEGSGEIETGTTDEVTITLGGAGQSVYPVKIVLTKGDDGSPSLNVNPKSLAFALTPANNISEQTFTLAGKNLADGEYALTVPNVAGLTVSPASFRVVNGVADQLFTVKYESTADIAKATADITAKVGDLTASVAVTYQSRATVYTQSTVSEAATWDWSKLSETVQLSAETTPKQTDEFLLAELDDRITFTENFGDSKAIVMNDMQFPSRAGYAQGNIIKFKTSVAGTIDVDFSNTGGNRPYRHLYVNGESTDFKSNTADKVNATGIEVPAGEVELKGYIPDDADPVARQGDAVGDAMLRWYKIVFTPKAGDEPVTAGFRDIKVNLMEHPELLTGNDVYITVAEDGTIGTTDNAAQAAATIKGSVHNSYGSSNFTASVPVEGCVKITYATHDYGDDITVTNAEGAEVAKFNTQGAKWMSDPANVVVAYYRTNEPTMLNFSKARYNPYFAVEKIDPADIPAEVTKYNVTFETVDGVAGAAPAALEVEAGKTFVAPKNYTLYKEGYTLDGWTSGNAVYQPGQEITPEGDMTLAPHFSENSVSLADRTEPVTITYDLGGYNDNPKYNFQSGDGIIVTQATVNGKAIDVAVATNGKFAHNGSGWHQVNAGTKVTVPSCKGATFTVKTYNNANALKFGETAAEANADPATYEAAAVDETLVIEQTANGYWNKLEITLPVVEQGGEEPTPEPGEVTYPLTATWDYGNATVMEATLALSGSSEEGEVNSVENNVKMTVLANGATFRNNGNNIQVRSGAEFRIPVKSIKDVITIKGYPGYSYYSINGGDEIKNTNDNTQTEYTATVSDVKRGYVSIVSTNDNNYYYSISVVQNEPAAEGEPVLVEKSIYSTDFSDWEIAGATDPATVVEKQTKYTNETLSFELFQTQVMATEDAKFSSYTTLPHMTARAEKNFKSSIVTSPLASITKIRFIHGATGSSRGWKVEAKGDGDADWVVVSQDFANPNSWCEVTKAVNKKNVQLRFTNLADAQNAYLFELEIFGEVDLAGAPLLGSFKANGKSYTGDDFEMNNDGAYEGTFELFSDETMISANNPLTDITADSGELGEISYADGDNACTVTIPITAEKGSVNYIATFIRKPKMTLTYIDVAGETIGTQEVEKDTKIGEFAYDINDVASTRNGFKARGWFKQNYVGEKYTTESVVTEDITLYAAETEIEVASTSRKYEFNLGDKFFYAEDHEAFSPQADAQCKFHDTTHGWSAYNGDKIDLLVGPKAVISVGLCQYGSGTNILVKQGEETLATLDGKSDADGKLVSYTYEGEPGTITLEMVASGEMYIHNVKVVNIAEANYDQDGQWYFVKAGDVSSLKDVLDIVNGAGGTERLFIYLPNGIYDLGTAVQTTISRDNVSLIGESMEGAIIKNAPPVSVEGLMSASTLKNAGNNFYMQDLTLQNELDYYGSGSAGRANAFHDTGNHTVAKNVKLLSYQDTYLSSANKQLYWETSEIHGAVDYICGGGDVFFESCNLVNESRKKDEKNGSATITAHQPQTAEKFGYVFNNCTIENLAATFNFGRAWGGASGATVRPTVTYLNTTLNQPSEIVDTRFLTSGMNSQSGVFHEYNTLNKEGNVVSPASNIQTFTDKNGADAQTYETILSAEQAAAYAIEKVFDSWNPTALTKQYVVEEGTVKDNVLTWTPVEGAAGYAIFQDDELLAIVGADVNTYTVEQTEVNPDAAASHRAPLKPTYFIRPINPMGGMGEVFQLVESSTDGINAVKAGQQDADAIYTLQGVRVNKATKGVYIINGKKVVIK